MATKPIGPHYLNTGATPKADAAEDAAPLKTAFEGILKGAASVAAAAAPIAQGMISQVPGIGCMSGTLLNGLTLGGSGGMGGMSDQLALLREQERIQKETQVFTTLTNVSKSEHDAKMSAVRNMRP